MLSNYINTLYVETIEDFPSQVLDMAGLDIHQNYNKISLENQILLILSCSILEVYKNVKIDYGTLKRLFNRSPKIVDFSVKENCIYRNFDFKKLVRILNEHENLI